MKSIITILVIILIIGGVFWGLTKYQGSFSFDGLFSKNTSTPNALPLVENTSKPDINNATYRVEGISLNIIDGVAQTDPAYPEVNGVSLYGNPAYGDLNGDGALDAAVAIVNKDSKKYYGALVLNKDGKAESPNAVYLGENIKPSNVSVENGQAVYAFDAHTPNQSTTNTPTVPTTVTVTYNPTTNEATPSAPNTNTNTQSQNPTFDPSTMSLDMKEWRWQFTVANNGTKTYPPVPTGFTLKFNNNGTFNATADCNVVGGVYSTTSNQITFSELKNQNLSCPRSDETQFWKSFQDAESFVFTSSGELVLTLELAKGTAVFK